METITRDNVRLELTMLERARYERVRRQYRSLLQAEEGLDAASKLDAAPVVRDLFSGLMSHRLKVDPETEGAPLRRIVDWSLSQLELLPEWKGLKFSAERNVVASAIATVAVAEHLQGLDWPAPEEGEGLEEALEEFATMLAGDPLQGPTFRGQIAGKIRQAAKDAEETTEALTVSYGSEEGELDFQNPPKEALELAHRLQKDPRLRRFLELVGRLKDAMSSSSVRERAKGTILPYDIGVTRDFRQLIPSELALLAHPSTRAMQTVRVVSGQALGWQMVDHHTKGKGPFHVALDLSGSMGDAFEAKAFAAASVLHALDNGRAVSASVFDTRVKVICEGISGARERLGFLNDLLGASMRGGTDFRPVVESVDTLGHQDDVLLISDGCGPVDLERARQVFAKRALHYLVIGNEVDVSPDLKALAGKNMMTTQDLLSDGIRFAAEASRTT